MKREESDDMYTQERQSKILDILNKRKSISVNDLTKELNFSPATIRSDLNYLSEQGLLIRTHGGATIMKEQNNLFLEKSYSFRERKNHEEKKQIAKEAIQYIHDGECIILDASSTCYELANLLKNTKLRLTILTSGLKTAEILKNNPNITLILIGGIVKGNSNAIEGLLGIEILNKVHIDHGFFSGHAFDLKNGLSDFNLYEVELKRKMVEVSSKVFALVDDSKLNKNSIATFANTEQITTFITNHKSDKKIMDSYIKYGMDVVIAEK